MAKAGDSYTIRLRKSHLEWGTHRYTNSRNKIYGEGYIPIPARYARSYKLLNSNGTYGQDSFGKNLFNCTSADGLFSGCLRSQGCNYEGNPYAKQFSGDGDLKALGEWFAAIDADVGDQIEVVFTSPTDIIISKK